MTPAERTELARQAAEEAGIDAIGFARPTPGLGVELLDRWLAEGKAAEMNYMARNRDARADPERILPGVRTVIVAVLNYLDATPKAPVPGQAKVSRYAWGTDYHDVLRERLHRVANALRNAEPTMRTRAVVDSAPLVERDYAQLAGLGWIGKNTLLLNRRMGSWFFLGALLVDGEFVYDAPFPAHHCGTCTRCLDACPTDAFEGPYRLDPRKCISYLTIEHRSPIPVELRPGIGDWLFGCDVCQEVCPWNVKREKSRSRDHTADAAGSEFAPRSGNNPAAVAELLELDEAAFQSRFRGTPLFRTRRAGIVRNACIVAGNQRLESVRPLLEWLAANDAEPVVREAALWAIDRIGSAGSR